MFFFNGKYTSTIQVNGVEKIISRIGSNRVFYDCYTHKIMLIGADRVVYDETLGFITKIGALDVLYDAETRRISTIGKLAVNYDEQTGCILSIGSATVFYSGIPTQYVPVEGEYFSPLKGNLEPYDSNELQPVGLSFESANRERMREFITALSNLETRESALFKIEHNIREEREERANNQHYSDGYCSEALKIGAIEKIATLLTDTKLRHKAQLALLSLFSCIQDTQRPEFMQQIKAEASLIITSMVTVMSLPIQNSHRNLNKEIKSALDLFVILPFSDPEIQKLIIENKLISLLVSKRSNCFGFETFINQLLEKIMQTSPAYKNVVLRAIRAEKLAQNPLPFSGLDLKNYYMSHSTSSFKGGLFKDVGDDPSKLDTLLEALQIRAEQTPGGASEQTINHFLLGKG